MNYEPAAVIHLEECDPQSHGWEQVEYRTALEAHGQLCDRAAYMDGELFADEMVWLDRAGIDNHPTGESS